MAQQQAIEPGTPIEDVSCSVCGGTVTLTTGKRPGDLLKGRCSNTLENGKACMSWFTAGKNPSYLLKQNFMKSLIESAENDNEENTSEAANDNEEESAACTEGESTDQQAGCDSGGSDSGQDATSGTGDDRSRGNDETGTGAAKAGTTKGFFKRGS